MTTHKIVPGDNSFVFDAKEHFHWADLPHLDADLNLFLSRELLFAMPKMIETIYTQRNARRLLPINRSVPVGAQSYKWEQETDFGNADWAKGRGDAAIPTVNSQTEEQINQVASFMTSATWDIEEIRAAAFAGRPLNPRYVRAARRAMLDFENEIAFNGNADRNITGILSGNATTSIPEAAATNGAWTIATQAGVDNILADLYEIAEDVPNQSDGHYEASRLVLPRAEFHLISHTKAVLADGDTTTIKELFLRNNSYIREIVAAEEFAANNHPGIDAANPIMMAYDPSPDFAELVVPLEVMQHAPERDVLSTRVIWESQTGGVAVYSPLRASVRTGI